MVSAPNAKKQQSNQIANYINENISVLIDVINNVSPEKLSALSDSIVNAINKTHKAN
jgi:hypothetical protein